MNEEQGFLQALRDDPKDDTTRLVYADWLDDRGDVRGEFLRLQHQRETISQRLAELQAQIDPAWVLAVSKKRRLVLLSHRPNHKIMVIKLVREVTSLGLKEAVDLVQALPSVILSDLSGEEAARIAQRFHGFATVAIESVSAPRT